MADIADRTTLETMSVSENPNFLERGQSGLSANRENFQNHQEGQNQELSISNEQWDWETDSDNPYNWPASRKAWQIAIVSTMAFTAVPQSREESRISNILTRSFGTSVMTAAPEQLIEEFGFFAMALLPVPWKFFKFGKAIRLRSRYEASKF
ncbi:uncharacterized protein TRIVIDRAFT_224640 [Trichoderma virens Gv29-8]|uniref:Uncharacterized protein n=1 Tax=Hypocrea virens (strain Gv29-8 / FGSC 10586) TaxID=413071 RepID=G9N0W4_HYPVG|nr:uncharacterized protein TRIVIDRAFT_224640 [Trichoderma virens Gv29-8]EHK19397.1 hypothetical protein TRIVIDRAFT_224640 [Trichoderma virens Gv29-8]UKZ58342.1 hypothetical protein TrVGV298_012210 [Trichoderma virens]UKZ84025.1 hypothetical protein TrVFT333_011841 [Trichoderma virens FT-333]